MVFFRSLKSLRNSVLAPDILLFSGACFFCFIVLTRFQLSNGFTVLAGDRYDAVISTTILEHWFRFFLGHVSWVDVGYYFPYEKSIAYTDAYFINGVFYTPFRLIGFESCQTHLS